MGSLKRRKGISLRPLLLSAAWLSMVAVAFYYLYAYRTFAVDDRRFENVIKAAADRHKLDWQLVRAVIYEESKFYPGEVGNAGEIGLMQIMPRLAAADWARANKKAPPSKSELFSPELNIEIGCWFLRDGFKRFSDYEHAAELALARYNAGLSRARKWAPENKQAPVIDNISIVSTRRYVSNIMKRYQRYKKEEVKNNPRN